jgi:hypothetical protein
MQPQRGRRCKALLILNFGARWRGGGGAVVIPGHGRLSLPGKSPGTQCTGGRVGPGTGLDGCGQEEISFPHRGSTLLVLLGKHFDTGNV